MKFKYGAQKHTDFMVKKTANHRIRRIVTRLISKVKLFRPTSSLLIVTVLL